MADNKTTKSDTLKSEKAVYAVKLDDGTIVSVEATSAEESIRKAKAKER